MYQPKVSELFACEMRENLSLVDRTAPLYNTNKSVVEFW